MKIQTNARWSTVCVLALVLAGCEPTETPSEATPDAQTTVLEQAVDQRGEPCTCVAENMEAMRALLESLESTKSLSSQELNAQVAEMVLPCMKPTGNAESDRAYSRAMGECEAFAELTGVMNQVKDEVQSRIEKEVRVVKKMSSAVPKAPRGAKLHGASDQTSTCVPE